MKTLNDVFMDLQKFCEKNNIAEINTPVSIGVLASGGFRVTHSLSEVPAIFETPQECIDHISSWLEDNKNARTHN